MNGHDGIHGILLGTQHHLELFVPHTGSQFIEVPAHFRQSLVIILLPGHFIKLSQIVRRFLELFPVTDDMTQACLLFENIAGFYLIVPEILPRGNSFEFLDVSVFFRDVKDIPRAGRFFYSLPQWLQAVLQSCHLLLFFMVMVNIRINPRMQP
jgi:hypothetical protein